MKSTVGSIVSVAALVSSVAAHGFITSPPPRQAGDAMKAVCGEQMFNNQNSDTYGNIQGELQVGKSQSDFDAAKCNVWLCKGFQFDDNKDNVQTFTAGQSVDIKVDIRAPHTGTANVSIVKTSSDTMLGSILKSFDPYASTATGVTEDEENFSITIPSDLGSQCSTAGDCVIQWWWDSREVDQTYESCIDFTVGGSGDLPAPSSGSGSSSAAASPTAVSSAAPVSSAAASVTSAPSATVSAVNNVASATSTAAASLPTGGASSDLPKTFTLDTFISWLEEAGKSSAKKARAIGRVHARAF